MSAAHDFRTPFLGAAAAALLVLTGASSAAMASPTTLADVGEPSQTELDDSIDDLDENTTDLLENTDEVETTETDGSETTISLSSDILFDFDSSTVKDAAKTRIRELVADIPDGARIEVHGHTDSKGDDDYNQSLSEDRAQAVADVISDERSDVELDVEGYGETQPVAPNESRGEDDPDGRAENRRVEIAYEG